MSKPNNNTVSAEYSPSDKSKCKKCWRYIKTGEIRIGHWIQSQEFDGTVANWYHTDCFFSKFPPGTPSCPISASTDIKGIHDLTWVDIINIATNKFHEPEFSHGRTPTTRKLNYVRTALRTALDMLDIADLKRLLEHNGQIVKPGHGKGETVRRCIDGMLYGALPQCPECGSEGTLYWDMDLGAYKCFADASEWAKCQYEMKDFSKLKRTKWEMIREFSGIKWLDDWIQPDVPEYAVVPVIKSDNNVFEGTQSDTMKGGLFGFNLNSTTNSIPISKITPNLFAPIQNSTVKSGGNKSTVKNIPSQVNSGNLFGNVQNNAINSIPISKITPNLFMSPSQNNSTVNSTIFKGMFIYILTNGKYLMRSESRRIESSGGTIIKKFDKNIDLCVARNRTNLRIELICDWHGVPIVTPDYFAECFKRDTLLDPAYFEPNQYVKTSEIKPWKDYVPVRERKEYIKENTKKDTTKSKLEPKSQPQKENNPIVFGKFTLNESDDNSDSSDSEDEIEEKIAFTNTGSYFTGSVYEPLKASQPSDMQQLCDISNFSIVTEQDEEKDRCTDPFTMYLAHYGQSDGMFLNPGCNEPVNLLGPKAIKISKCDAPFEPVQHQSQLSKSNQGKKTVPKKKKVTVSKNAVNKESGLCEKYHVLPASTDDENDLYNAVLSSSDLSTQQNSYYYMQILEPDDKKAGKPYIVWMKWGRVGTAIGKSKVERTNSVDVAIKLFCEKYREKTLNDWSMRKSFKKMPRAFYPLDVDYNDDSDNGNDAVDGDDNNSKPSKLDKRVYKLVETLFDADKIRKEMASIGIDTTKMPLGKLRRETIMDGYKTLKEIESILSKKISTNKVKLLELSNKFYTIIPHSFGVGVSPPLINTKELLLSKMSMMETLSDIQVTACLMKQDDDTDNNKVKFDSLNPIDIKYKRMNVELTPIETNSSEWDFLRNVIRNTVPKACGFRLDLNQAFRVDRNGEQRRFEAYSYADGRRLLWHGSRLTNYVGILSQGLRIAPPEAPVSGYMFGKGIYLADMAGKSAEYCHATPSSPNGIILLCEAALGTEPFSCKKACYVEKSMLESLGKESTMGLGRLNPAPHNNRVVKTKGGLLMKSGAVVAMGPEEQSSAGSDCELEHNEFIVYDVERVVIRYALDVNFVFADGWEARDITYGLNK